MNNLLALLIVGLIVVQCPRLFWSSASAAQEKKQAERDQLRLRTDLVQVRAVVTDKRGQPVGNLTKDDFEVLEDSRPQTISFFSVENIGTPADSRIPSDSKTPAVTNPGCKRPDSFDKRALEEPP